MGIIKARLDLSSIEIARCVSSFTARMFRTIITKRSGCCAAAALKSAVTVFTWLRKYRCSALPSVRSRLTLFRGGLSGVSVIPEESDTVLVFYGCNFNYPFLPDREQRKLVCSRYFGNVIISRNRRYRDCRKKYYKRGYSLFSEMLFSLFPYLSFPTTVVKFTNRCCFVFRRKKIYIVYF